MNRMYAAAQAGDRAGYDQASAQLINDVRNLLDDTRALAAKVSDPILQKELLAACDRLEALTPELIAAAQVGSVFFVCAARARARAVCVLV